MDSFVIFFHLPFLTSERFPKGYRRLKLLPYSNQILKRSGAPKNGESQKKCVSVNVLTASDNVPTFSTSRPISLQRINLSNELQPQLPPVAEISETTTEAPNQIGITTRPATPTSLAWLASVPTSSNSENEMETENSSSNGLEEVPSAAVSFISTILQGSRSL